MRPLLLLTLLLAACAHAGASSGASGAVRCELVGLDTAEESAVASFRITNDSDAELSYPGYEHGMPLYTCEILEGGAWEEVPIGWCGTGLTEQALAPGKAVEFQASVPADGRTYRFRLGDLAVVTPPVSAASK